MKIKKQKNDAGNDNNIVIFIQNIKKFCKKNYKAILLTAGMTIFSILLIMYKLKALGYC